MGYRGALIWLGIALLGAIPAAQAELAQPACSQLAAWAKEVEHREKWQISPASRIPASLHDNQLTPLFGRSILTWNDADFTAAEQILSDCHRQQVAAKARDAASGLVKVRQAIKGSRQPVRRAQQAITSAEESLASLLRLADQPNYLPAVNAALQALQGERGRNDATPFPDNLSRTAVSQLSQAYHALPEQAASELISRLRTRRSALEAAVKERQQQAGQQLADAGTRIDALPLTAASLQQLDQLAQLPAQQQATADALHRFQQRIDSKREQINAHLEQQQQQARQAADRRRLAELQQRLDNVPATQAGLAQLGAMTSDPALGRLPQTEVQPLLNRIRERQQALSQSLEHQRREAASQQADAVLAELEQVPVEEPADLGKLFQAGRLQFEQLRRQDPQTAALFFQRFHQRFADHATALLPAFEQQLTQYPASDEGIARLDTAVTDLTGVAGAADVMQAYHDAASQQAITLRHTMRREACAQIRRQVGMSNDDAREPVWTAAGKTTLGEFVCQLSEQGHQIHDYDAPGLFSNTHTLKLTVQSEGLKQIRLHPGEVIPDEELLLGYEVADANQTVSLSVTQWQQYTATLLDRAQAECEQLSNKPRSELSLNEQMTLMNCLMQKIPKMN